MAIYVHTTAQLDAFTVYVLSDAAGNPDLSDVLASAEVQNSVTGTDKDAEWLCADIADIAVNSGEQYWILLNEGGSSVRKNWHRGGGDPYPAGVKKKHYGDDNWNAYPDEDYTFRTYP